MAQNCLSCTIAVWVQEELDWFIIQKEGRVWIATPSSEQNSQEMKRARSHMQGRLLRITRLLLSSSTSLPKHYSSFCGPHLCQLMTEWAAATTACCSVCMNYTSACIHRHTALVNEPFYRWCWEKRNLIIALFVSRFNVWQKWQRDIVLFSHIISVSVVCLHACVFYCLPEILLSASRRWLKRMYCIRMCHLLCIFWTTAVL